MLKSNVDKTTKTANENLPYSTHQSK